MRLQSGMRMLRSVAHEAIAPGEPVPGSHAVPRYDDLTYRDKFWRERRYEDLADRIALRSLLAARGHRLLDLGAGFGRLVPEFRGWKAVTLVDASPAHLAAARQTWARDSRVRVELADAYDLPFDDASFDTVVCVRLLHHIERPSEVFAEIARVLAPGGRLVLEVANKRNLKTIGRWLLGLQPWSPFSEDPFAERPLHFQRHPRAVRRDLAVAGFEVEAARTASLFRIRWLSRRVPPARLGVLERPLQRLLAAFTPGPSLWYMARKRALVGEDLPAAVPAVSGRWRRT